MPRQNRFTLRRYNYHAEAEVFPRFPITVTQTPRQILVEPLSGDIIIVISSVSPTPLHISLSPDGTLLFITTVAPTQNLLICPYINSINWSKQRAEDVVTDIPMTEEIITHVIGMWKPPQRSMLLLSPQPGNPTNATPSRVPPLAPCSRYRIPSSL